MGISAIGTVVLINFPFADLKTYKKRPAVVAASGSLGTVILCQITSRHIPGVPGIKLTPKDFSEGGLPPVSYVRPDKLFTVDASVLKNSLGKLHPLATRKIRREVTKLFIG